MKHMLDTDVPLIKRPVCDASAESMWLAVD